MTQSGQYSPVITERHQYMIESMQQKELTAWVRDEAVVRPWISAIYILEIPDNLGFKFAPEAQRLGIMDWKKFQEIKDLWGKEVSDILGRKVTLRYLPEYSTEGKEAIYSMGG